MKKQTLKLEQRGLELRYVDEGQGALTLLFLHGWCINSSYWEVQVEHFSTSHRVIALDVPGFGDSKVEDRSDWGIPNLTADIRAMIEQLDLNNLVLIGHSMSGNLILELALQLPERVVGVVGVDNFKFVDMTFEPAMMEEFQGYIQGFHTNFAEAAPGYVDRFLLTPATPATVRSRLIEDISGADPSIAVPIFLGLFEYGTSVPEKLGQLDYPLHLIASDALPTYEPGLQQRCKKGYQMHFISDIGHYPMNEKPAEFNQSLEGILAGLSPN